MQDLTTAGQFRGDRKIFTLPTTWDFKLQQVKYMSRNTFTHSPPGIIGF